MAELRIESLTKRFGDTVVLDGFNLSIEDGELMTLLGPSGSGKTTLLRLVAGYIDPDAGAIRVDGQNVLTLPPEKRDIGMVFQSYALFPHRSLYRNVAFGLERRKVAREKIASRVAEALALVRLEGLDARFPSELSGGQQQRVALARALVIRPTLLLLDEPLSNLDARLRAELRLEIRRIQKTLGITTVLVTHDQQEALTVSDRVAVISNGKLQQLGTPDEIYRRPANRFVAEFVGKMNLLPADREGERVYRLATGETIRTADSGSKEHGLVAVRPEVVRTRAEKGWNRLEGTVAHRVFLGEITEIAVTLADGTLFLARGGDLPTVAPGETLTLSWPVEATALLDS